MGDFLIEVYNYTQNLLKIALTQFLVDIKYNPKLFRVILYSHKVAWAFCRRKPSVNVVKGITSFGV